MEKLSKEIVYLRNQQRLALRDRREEARSKKARAQERRQQHQQDLVDARLQVAALQREKEALQQQMGVLQTTLLGEKAARELVVAALEANKVVLLEQQQSLQERQAQVTRGEELLAQRETEWAQTAAQMTGEVKGLRASLLTAQLHVSVMARSNEACEER
jgi:hypothetical protein